MEGIFTSLYGFLSTNILLAVFSSFIWGVFSVILSPCHLSSIPLVIGVISNKSISIKKSFLISFVFSSGILVTLAAIWIITGIFGQILGDTGIIGSAVIAILLILMALYFLNVIHLNFLSGIFSQPQFDRKNLITAFVMGLFFGIGLGPCTFAYLAPILGVVFTTASVDIVKAVLLLTAFALGHTLVIILFGTFGKVVESFIKTSNSNSILKGIRIVCGIILLFGAVYFIIDIFHKLQLV